MAFHPSYTRIISRRCSTKELFLPGCRIRQSRNFASSFDVAGPRGSETRAVIVLLGWWGAERRQLQKYGEIYQNEKCTTVAGVANRFALLRKDDRSLARFADKCITETAAVLRMSDQKVPVIFHLFSNGGCFVFEQIELQLQKAPENSDSELVGRCLRGQLFDSCPSYVTYDSSIAALQGAFPSHIFRFLKPVIRLLYLAEMIKNKVSGIIPWPESFWDHFLNSKLNTSHAYIYSSNDRITDHSKIDELIKRRQESPLPVSVLKFSDSPHVQHFLHHEEEYKHFVIDFVDTVIKRKPSR